MDIYSRTIHSTTDSEIRITINEWNDVEYLHFRKYYLDFEGNWLPSKDGVSLPIDLNNIKEIFTAIVEILSDTECKTILEDNFKEQLDKLYK